MMEDVIITTQGRHSYESGRWDEPIVQNITGKHSVRNGNHFVLYEEEETESRVLLKFRDGYFKMTKGKTEMEFQKGVNTKGKIVTEEGLIDLDIVTTSVRVSEGQGKFSVSLAYTLFEGKSFLERARLTITVQKKKVFA